MIDFKNATFIKSTPNISEAPKEGYPEVLIVGKSNVGKSTLINSLCTKKRLAFTSSKPGHTKLLNYYLIDNKFYLVDAPGYGYATGGVDLDALFGEMMENYFSNAKHLKLVLILLDSRRKLGVNDLEIIDYVKANNIPYYLIVTKTDKVNQKEKSQLLKHLKEENIDANNVYYSSSLQLRSLEAIKRAIEKAL